MKTPQTILEQLTSSNIVDALVLFMTENFEDFAEDRQRYIQATQILQQELGEDSVPSVSEEMESIQQQTVSNLLFSGFLGLKANLDYFIDPISKNFLSMDPETYLRENTAHRLPAYEQAQETRERFYSLLTPEHRHIYENIITYVCHLETVGPKLAHYYGFLLGNALLPWVVPGYHPDTALTMQYSRILEKYFGKSLDIYRT